VEWMIKTVSKRFSTNPTLNISKPIIILSKEVNLMLREQLVRNQFFSKVQSSIRIPMEAIYQFLRQRIVHCTDLQRSWGWMILSIVDKGYLLVGKVLLRDLVIMIRLFLKVSIICLFNQILKINLEISINGAIISLLMDNLDHQILESSLSKLIQRKVQWILFKFLKTLKTDSFNQIRLWEWQQLQKR